MPTDTLKRFTRPELISMLTEARVYWTEARVDRNHDKRKLWAKAAAVMPLSRTATGTANAKPAKPPT